MPIELIGFLVIGAIVGLLVAKKCSIFHTKNHHSTGSMLDNDGHYHFTFKCDKCEREWSERV